MRHEISPPGRCCGSIPRTISGLISLPFIVAQSEAACVRLQEARREASFISPAQEIGQVGMGAGGEKGAQYGLMGEEGPRYRGKCEIAGEGLRGPFAFYEWALGACKLRHLWTQLKPPHPII